MWIFYLHDRLEACYLGSSDRHLNVQQNREKTLKISAESSAEETHRIFDCRAAQTLVKQTIFLKRNKIIL